MHKNYQYYQRLNGFYLKIVLFILIALHFDFQAIAQVSQEQGQADTVPTKDLIDLVRKIRKSEPDTAQKKKSGLALLPTLGYNPSLGFQIGGKISAQRNIGDPSNTNLSVLGMIFAITSKGIINAQLIHNIFTPENKLNWQGNWQISLFGVTDYGIGPGHGYPDSTDLIKFGLLRAFEIVYFPIGNKSYVGGGLNIVFRNNIKDENQSDTYNTANTNYSIEKGFNPERNFANGIIAAYQYNSREHPVRSYGGIYAEGTIQINQKWLGSTKEALQMGFDFRKYWSLSKKNPTHVLALWSLASFKLEGELPYLELPNTASDAYARSGRGYTISRFKGPSSFYLETEYRFPITANKFLSGVAFVNTQTTSDSENKNLFKNWGTAVGAGLRILMQKQQRTTICVDYARGEFGAYGIYFGLNEAF